jgi:hypothetical protein
MTWGADDPDPHFRMEVSAGQFRCAVPGCTEHVYLSVPKAQRCRFEGGSAHGEYRDILDPPGYLELGTESYEAGYYEDGVPRGSGNTVLVYSLQYSKDDDGTNYAIL